MPPTIRIDTARAVRTITLARPDVHNAFNPQMIAEVTEAFLTAGTDADVRVVILTGEGRSFSAGADLAWMKAMAGYSEEDNVEDARRLDAMFHAMIGCPKPIVGRINGAAFGGGLGLIACCDIVVAVEVAKFAFTEVNLGMVPAVIAPYVARKTGLPPLAELFLTGARFDTARAQVMGLVHYPVQPANLDGIVQRRVSELLTSAPGAVAAAKALLGTVQGVPVEQVREYTAKLIARLRVGPEGQEGMTAFLDKRKPGWANG